MMLARALMPTRASHATCRFVKVQTYIHRYGVMVASLQ
ncbi:hypothetical protein HMPREF1316_1667 [Olsenella profusa F0195]|uniref:Uncharacterized protein n=1 Tax=Olsenella profusa F0195 TaxID=1125712 RepID=U2TT23_9ACTN|nr:hypothetical protein HMPREF1316_1667 [Olsenella profusa F0195]